MNVFLVIIAFALIAWLALGLIGGPFLIGKPRQPLTAGGYAGVLITGLAVIGFILYAALSMLGVAA